LITSLPDLSAMDKQIVENQLELAQHITGLHFKHHPELNLKYGKAGRDKCLQDSQYHLTYLAEAIRADSTEIFTSYLEWAQGMLQARHIPVQHLIDNLGYIDLACRELLPGKDHHTIAAYITDGIKRLKSMKPLPDTCFALDNPLLTEAKQYLALLLDGNRKQAQFLILDLVKKNQSISTIYEYIFQATQYEVGLLWQTNKITVAHEHYCTAATQLIMSSLYTYIFDSEKKGLKMLACAVSGDLHEIGIRMISDFFEMDGWDTYYMGANMPDANIITAVKEHRANILAISVTMPFYISKAEDLIKKIRSDDALSSIKIIVGGYPFSLVPDLWKRIGADGAAKSAREAILLSNIMTKANLNVQ
jgi:methanogenic corrinoid protein MtbC1